MKSGKPQISGVSRRDKLCLLSIPCLSKALKVKMGRGGQDELAGKSGIISDEKKGGVVSCGPFHIP